MPTAVVLRGCLRALALALVVPFGCSHAESSEAAGAHPVGSAAAPSTSVAAGTPARKSDAGLGAASPNASALPVAGASTAGHDPSLAKSGPPADLNVVLLTIDSLRADMPWAGYPRSIAPNLTAFEAEAVSYTRAYSLSSYTSMSLGGLLGGRYPGEMKRDGYFFGTYHKDNLMFPERLKAAQIRTVTAHAHGYFRKGASGFEQGFDVYEIIPGLKWNAQTDENITSPGLEKMAERLLGDSANTSGRFFAWFHFLDPHDQYLRHPDVELYGKRARDLYDGEVTFTDRYVGKLLEFIRQQPWGARTAIIVSADHGEAFGEHNAWRHGFELWQMLVRVPWMFSLPGVSPRRIDVSRSHLDLAPTILELMGVPFDDCEGHSLVGEIYGRVTPEPRDVIVDLPRTSDSDRRRALIHDPYKLIAYGDDTYFQIYDLTADPDETKSIEKTNRAALDQMLSLYKSKKALIKDVGPYACRTLKGAPEGRGY